MVRRAVCLLSAIAMLTAGFAGQANAGLFKKKHCGGCEPAPCGCEAAPACGGCDAGCDACGGAPAGCEACAAEAPAPTMVMKTIMVPTYVTETRMITATEYKQEERTKTYTVNKRVPVTE